LLNKWTAAEEFLAGEINLVAALRRAVDEARWWVRPLRWWRLMQQLNRLIAEIDRYRITLGDRVLSDKNEPVTNSNRSGLLQRWFAHRADEATIAFLVLPDRTLTIVIQRWRLSFSISAISRIVLRDLVRQRPHHCVAVRVIVH
jgi:hypothetical protein